MSTQRSKPFYKYFRTFASHAQIPHFSIYLFLPPAPHMQPQTTDKTVTIMPILAQKWLEYCMKNPGMFNTTDHALYLYFLYVGCIQMKIGQFGVNASLVMQTLGIGSYNTYKRSVEKLAEHGFIKMVSKSANQYTMSSINVVGIGILPKKKLNTKNINDSKQKNTILNNKQTEHLQETGIHADLIAFEEWLSTNAPNVLKMEKQLTYDQYQKLFSKYHDTEILDIIMAMENHKPLLKKYTSVYFTADTWLENRVKRATSNSGNQTGQPKNSKVTDNIQRVLQYGTDRDTSKQQ